MKHLFSADLFRDFGPLGLAGDLTPPALVRIDGGKTAELRRQLRLTITRQPGVYGMLDGQGQLHYVGKAKNLRSRLLSYFRPASRNPKAGRIIRATRSIVWEAWPREFSALLRELELIRRWRPRWNVLGQPLPMRHALVCLGKAPAPHLYLARQTSDSALASFGPVPATRKSFAAVRLLNDAFRLRDCPQPTEMAFSEQSDLFPGPRPVGCLRLDLGTCLAPCTGECSRRSYFAQVKKARLFFEGDTAGLIEDMRRDMARAAAEENFEKAAVLRDKLDAIEWFAGRLDKLRQMRKTLSFIYPVAAPQGTVWWYFIQAGRPVLVLPAPRSHEQARAALTALEKTFHDNDHPALLESFQHLDGMLLVSRWFRENPRERQRALPPDRAAERCRYVLGRA